MSFENFNQNKYNKIIVLGICATKPVPGMNNLFEILSRHAYSWVPDKIKSSEELSDKLANDLKGKDLTKRRNIPYLKFKQNYCS